MLIQYFGLACLKFSTKLPSEANLLTDPFESKVTGLKLAKTKANIVLSSEPGSPLANSFSTASAPSEKEVNLITSPGEYEIADIFVQAIPWQENPDGNIFFFEIEKISVAFLGNLPDAPLSNGQLEVLEDADILILPVGDKLTPKQAKQIVNQVEPRVIIPSYFKVPGLKKPKLASAEAFLKELSVKHVEHVDKLKLTKKDLPAEDRHVYVLKP